MKEYNPNQILISQHIPKCAGTSFIKVLSKWYGLGFYKHYFDHAKSRVPRRPASLRFVKKFIPVCIHGHFDYEKDGVGIFDLYPEAVQLITVVRDPLEMQLSLYFYMKRMIEHGDMYWKGKQVKEMKYGGDIDAWVELRPSYMMRFFPFDINIENYKTVLSQNFIHIGVTENMQLTVDILAEKLKRKKVVVTEENKTRREYYPSETSIKIFKEKHRMEYMVYEYSKNLNKV